MLTNKKIKEIIVFLDSNKGLVGLSDWSFFVKPSLVTPPSIAEIGLDIYEQTGTLEVSKDFLSKNELDQKKVLLHELIHARINVFNQKVDKFKEMEEEFLVNDLERGFFKKVKKHG